LPCRNFGLYKKQGKLKAAGRRGQEGEATENKLLFSFSLLFPI
jgi:hypothetical protein